MFVIAVNNIGRGPPSAPVTVTTGETGNSSVLPFTTLARFEKKFKKQKR